MAATATARPKVAARTQAPARKRAPQRAAPRRRQHTPVTGFVPVAVGAVGGIADSGLVVRLTRGRLWIGMLAGLLVGIVALNVIALSFSASSSEAGREADALKRQNSAYRAEIATLTASQQVQETAARLGLHIPNPNQIGYLRPSPGDAAEAAKRLRAGELGTAEYIPPAGTPVAPVEEAAVEAPVTEPVATAPATESAPEASAPAPAATEAPAAAPTAVSGGGLSSP